MASDIIADGRYSTTATMLGDMTKLLERITGRRAPEDSDRPPARSSGDLEGDTDPSGMTLALPAYEHPDDRDSRA